MAFSDVTDFNDQLIRKALQGILLVADYATDALTTISTTGGELSIPAGYVSLGKMSADGADRQLSQDIADILGWGDSAPARRDVDKEGHELTVTAIETKKKVLELWNGVDLSSVVADANDEVTFDRPLNPTLTDYRTLLLTKDVNKSNGLEVYFGIHFPRANFTVNGNQSLQATGAKALDYSMKVTALSDSTAGTAVRTFWAGPGMAGLKTPMGF